MLKHLLWSAAFILVIASCSPVFAQQNDAARFRYSLWSSEMSTKLEVTAGTTFGTEFSLNELAMDKKEAIEIWELELWQGSMRLDVSYWEHRWDGYAQIGRDIAFEGITYNLADVVDSSFRMKATDVSITSNITQQNKAAFGIVGGIKYIEYYSKLWNVTGSVAAKEECVAPIPYLGVSVEMQLGETTLIGGRFVMFNYAYGGTHVDVSNFYQVDVFMEFRTGTTAAGPGRSRTGLALRIGFHNMVVNYYNRTPGDRFKISQLMKGSYVAVYISF